MQAQNIEAQNIAIPVSIIVPGRNPRSYFDPQEMKELEDSIRAQGVIQPILTRPVTDGKLEIVAGERRWRAAVAVGLAEIPAMIREMTDAEVDAAALTENVERAQMSPTEEAEAAARVLGNCAGDREEAAKRLGWSRTTLDKRLALMNCSENVRRALNERKISLGHAELMAAVPRQQQDVVLDKISNLQTLPTVANLKGMLEGIAQNLETAIFDKEKCIGCPHNSGTQQALFSEAIAGAKCTNASCFQQKTDDALAKVAESLKDEYPTVRIVQPGENFTILKLVPAGNCGVGEDQAKQCRACANFGAAISAVPGKIGNVYRDQCFDPACNSKKVAERIKAEKAAAGQAAQPKAAGKAAAKPASAASPSETKKVKGKEGKVEDSQRVKDYRLGIWRKVYKLEAQKPEHSVKLLVALALEGKLGKVGSSALCKAFGILTGSNGGCRMNLQETATAVASVAEDVQHRFVTGIAASCFEGLEEIDIKRLLAFMKVDLGQHWVLNADYLELLTKSEIQVVIEEIGLAKHLGDKLPKMLSSKKDELIKGLLAADGFDYQGKVPGHLHYDR